MTMRTVPLSVLRFGDEAPGSINARSTGREEELGQLVASIRANGLIQPLTARAGREDGEDVFHVIDGNRRLAALRAIAEADGADFASAMIPIYERLATSEAAFEASLAANVVRAPLHPVDQYEAFARLAADGMSEADIAARFAISTKGVKQRLALGKLSPKIRKAWRDGELGEMAAEIAMAFTLTDDHKRQEQLYAKLKKRGHFWSHTVRQELGAGDRDAARLMKFVGVKAYTAAGGQVAEDLFGDDHAISDIGLLERLAAEKLEAKCAELKEDGWSWAELAGDMPHSWNWGWEKLSVSKKKATADQKAKSGCVVSLNYEGQVDVTYGVVKPAQAKKDAAGKRAKDGKTETKEPTISNAMMHRLSVALTVAVRQSLPASPQIALAALVAGLIADAGQDGPVRLRCEGYGWHQPRPVGERFADVFRRLSDMPLDDLLVATANAMARAIDFQRHHADSPPQASADFTALFDALDPAALNAALAETWDVEDYFGGIAKPLVLRAIEEAIGPDEARKAGSKKKKELTEFAVANVPKTGWLPPQLRTAHYQPPRPAVAEAAE